MAEFEFNGKMYQNSSRHQFEWGKKIIDELNLKGDETVLDLGCGDGRLSKLISENLPDGKVIALDASEGMIEAAKQFESDNLQFLLMDINNLDLDMKFDIIFSNAALHWIKDHDKLIAKSSSLLNKNGKIRFNFASAGNCATFYQVIRQVMNMNIYKEYFSDFNWPWYMPTINDYKEKWQNFSDINIWEENADRYFKDQNEMIAWIDQPSIVPFIKLIPDDKKELFRSELISKMTELTMKSNGRCFEQFRRINILCQKTI